MHYVYSFCCSFFFFNMCSIEDKQKNYLNKIKKKDDNECDLKYDTWKPPNWQWISTYIWWRNHQLTYII